jgi:hypothetical protein
MLSERDKQKNRGTEKETIRNTDRQRYPSITLLLKNGTEKQKKEKKTNKEKDGKKDPSHSC